MFKFTEDDIRALEEFSTSVSDVYGFYRFINTDVLVDLWLECGFSHDAAKFMAEWCPEYCYYALQALRYDYGSTMVRHFRDADVDEYLAELGNYVDMEVTEDNLCEAEEKFETFYGCIFKNSAFEGIVMIGE